MNSSLPFSANLPGNAQTNSTSKDSQQSNTLVFQWVLIGLALLCIPVLVYIFGKCIEKKFGTQKKTAKVQHLDQEMGEPKKNDQLGTARGAEREELNLKGLLQSINDSQFQLVKHCEVLSRTIELP